MKSFFRTLLVFFRTERDVKNFSLHVAGKVLGIDDVCSLAAVAAELGVGVQEARDGTWRQRFQVVDE